MSVPGRYLVALVLLAPAVLGATRVLICLGADNGEALLLSRLLEQGNTYEARCASRVLHPLFDGPVSHSGYLTVNKTCNSNLFFWFVRAEENADAAPLVVWLQGGPGYPSTFGLFNEVGPWGVEGNITYRRDLAWTKKYNVVFFDSPVGTGYSFTDLDEGYATEQSQVGDELLSALTQLYRIFPELADKDLFLTGESYAGKYVPALGRSIHLHNENAESTRINLRGLMIASGWTDPINMLRTGDYLYQLGILDKMQLAEARKMEDEIYTLVQNEKWAESLRKYDEYFTFGNHTGFSEFGNILHTDDNQSTDYEDLLKLQEVKKALHVGRASFEVPDSKVYHHMEEDFMKSCAPWVADLLEYYPVCFFNGQFDASVAFTYTETFLRKLEWSGSEGFKTAERRMWKVDGDLAGYSKTYGALSLVLVRNAGHTVPADQPLWVLDLLDKFTSSKPLV